MTSMTFAEQLSHVTGRKPRGKKKVPQYLFNYPLKDTRHIGRDGVDHINTTTKVATKLGSMLSSQARSYFKHNLCGQFVSME